MTTFGGCWAKAVDWVTAYGDNDVAAYTLAPDAPWEEAGKAEGEAEKALAEAREPGRASTDGIAA